MLISVQNFEAAFVGNVINLKLFAKILGSMWSSTPTNCYFIELCRWSSTPTNCAFIKLHRASLTPTDCALIVSLCSVDFHTYRMVKFPYHTEKILCNFFCFAAKNHRLFSPFTQKNAYPLIGKGRKFYIAESNAALIVLAGTISTSDLIFEFRFL